MGYRTPQRLSYRMGIIHAALQAISPELYEAARIDGANDWQIALRVKVPLVLPTLVLTGAFSIIGALHLFSGPQIFEAIAPSVVKGYSTPNLYTYHLAWPLD